MMQLIAPPAAADAAALTEKVALMRLSAEFKPLGHPLPESPASTVASSPARPEGRPGSSSRAASSLNSRVGTSLSSMASSLRVLSQPQQPLRSNAVETLVANGCGVAIAEVAINGSLCHCLFHVCNVGLWTFFFVSTQDTHESVQKPDCKQREAE